MQYDCWCKVGNNWSYKGSVFAPHELRAAKLAQALYGRKTWKVQPKHSLDKPSFFRFKNKKQFA